ncbi:MAG: phage tail protein [Pseudomonadota bacterium]
MERPVAFQFQVSFVGAGDGALTRFSEISGLDQQMSVEEVTESGENRFVHRLPARVKQGNLVLKRGLAQDSAAFVTWCRSTIELDLAEPIVPKDIIIALHGQDPLPLMRWSISDAYPVKCNFAALDAMQDALKIEAIELAYRTLKRIP